MSAGLMGMGVHAGKSDPAGIAALNATLTVFGQVPALPHAALVQAAMRGGEHVMAKKAKKGEEEGAVEDGEAKPGKSKLVLIAAGVAVVAALGGGGYWFFKKRGAEEVAKVEVKKPVSFVEMKEMTINLASGTGQERASVMKVKVALELSDPKLTAEIQPMLPRIEDTFLVFLRELRPVDLEGSAGVYRLKEELLRRVNVAVHPARVDAVLFKEILVH